MSQLRESDFRSLERDYSETQTGYKMAKKTMSISNGIQMFPNINSQSTNDSVSTTKINFLRQSSYKENNLKNQGDSLRAIQIVRGSSSASLKNAAQIITSNYSSTNHNNNNNNRNSEVQIEMNSIMSEKSSKEYQCSVETKAKWVFMRLVEMNIIQYTYSEVEDILNINDDLQSLKKEQILQRLIEMNFLTDEEQNQQQVAIDIALLEKHMHNKLIEKQKKKQLQQVQQHIGDDRVPEMEKSIDQGLQTEQPLKTTAQKTGGNINEMNAPINIHHLNEINANNNSYRYTKHTTIKQPGKINQSRNYLLSEKDGGITCSICCLSYLPEYFYILLSCKHLFCKGCTIQYLESCINTSKVLKIRCPDENCNIEFTETNLSSILDTKLFEKYQRFKELKIINSDPTLKWCNRPGCKFYCKVDPNSQKIVCVCGNQMCFNCGNNWHEGKTCDDQIQEEFQGAIQKYIISYCPTCKSKVQKASGCNRILCPICSEYFCWICRTPKISYAHFSHLNVLGCPGKQFSKSNPDENPKYSKLLLFIPRLIIFFIILGCFAAMLPFCLLGLALITPNYLYWYQDDQYYDQKKVKYSFKKVLWISTLLFLLGIVFFPICLIPGSCIVLHRIIKNRF